MQLQIFVAGPLGGVGRCDAREQVIRVEEACAWGEQVRSYGHVPFVPHLFWYWATLQSTELRREDWIEMDNFYLRRSHGVVRLDGESPGADAEMTLAQFLGIPKYDIRDPQRPPFQVWLRELEEIHAREKEEGKK